MEYEAEWLIPSQGMARATNVELANVTRLRPHMAARFQFCLLLSFGFDYCLVLVSEFSGSHYCDRDVQCNIT